MSEDKAPELHVERNGWILSVTRKGDIITFLVAYSLVFTFASIQWSAKLDAARQALLTNLEEAMGLRQVRAMGFKHPVLFGKNTDRDYPTEWCVSQLDNAKYPYSVTFSWCWSEQAGKFRQSNYGEIWLTKEEVEILHQIFS